MAENVRKKQPERKAPIQRNEIECKYSPEQNLYFLRPLKGAKLPEELSGAFTSPKFANKAITQYFK